MDSSIRVLVVDDSAVVRMTLQSILERDDDIHVIGCAVNGVEAIEMVRRLRPDVVTLDVQMPVLDGLSALRVIMRDTPTPVLMVSTAVGDGRSETTEALALGAVHCVPKPSLADDDVAKISGELIYRVKLAHACAR